MTTFGANSTSAPSLGLSTADEGSDNHLTMQLLKRLLPLLPLLPGRPSRPRTESGLS